MFLSKYLTDTFTNKSKHLLYTLNKKSLSKIHIIVCLSSDTISHPVYKVFLSKDTYRMILLT